MNDRSEVLLGPLPSSAASRIAVAGRHVADPSLRQLLDRLESAADERHAVLSPIERDQYVRLADQLTTAQRRGVADYTPTEEDLVAASPPEDAPSELLVEYILLNLRAELARVRRLRQ